MNATSSKLGRALTSLYSSDAACRSLMDWFHERQRGSVETKVRVAASRTGHSESDMRAALARLMELEVGQFIVGRRGFESRMRWYYDVRSLAAVARGETTEEPEEVAENAPRDDDDDQRGDLLDHEFRLRPQLTIAVSLPNDLTKGEAERVASWVRSLPFEAA